KLSAFPRIGVEIDPVGLNVDGALWGMSVDDDFFEWFSPFQEGCANPDQLFGILRIKRYCGIDSGVAEEEIAKIRRAGQGADEVYMTLRNCVHERGMTMAG